MSIPSIAERRRYPVEPHAEFERRLAVLERAHDALLNRHAERVEGNGILERYRDPVLTAAHTPLFWRYDLDATTNPLLLERMAINAVFNPGAIKLGDMYLIVARVEGADRKSFFAVAESNASAPLMTGL